MVAGTFGGEGEKRIPPFDAVAIAIGALWNMSPPAAAPWCPSGASLAGFDAGALELVE